MLIPLALLVGALRWQLLPGRRWRNWVLAVGRPLSAEGLRDALATVLRDPTLAVAYRRSGRTDWVDGHGRAVTLPRPDDPARAIALIEGDDGPVAALVHDRALLSDLVLLPPSGAAARMTPRQPVPDRRAAGAAQRGAPRAHAWWKRPTPSAGGSSATCTTAPSSGC